jgi:ComF family protein
MPADPTPPLPDAQPVPAPHAGRARLTAVLRAAAAAVSDVLIPPVCLACRTPLSTHDTICAACWADVKCIHPPVCDRLGIPLPYDPGAPGGNPPVSAAAPADPPDYERARAAAHFDGVMRDLMHAFKYADCHDGRRLFGRWLSQAARPLLNDVDLIVPVPLHPHRLRARRFNQSALLAQELAWLSGLPYEPLILKRDRNTASQVGLTRDQRRQNLQGAFSVPPEAANRIHGHNVLLVDDVITTGTTTNACARVLKRAGAARVDVAALGLVTDDARINP